MGVPVSLPVLFKGDLVKFVAPKIFSDAEKGYAASGIVMETTHNENFLGIETSSAKVYWADGKVTNEHFGYLEKISSSSFSS